MTGNKNDMPDQMSNYDKWFFTSRDPVSDMPYGTHLLYQVCGNDRQKFEIAERLLRISFEAGESAGTARKADTQTGIPENVIKHVQMIGRAEWGTTKEQTDAEHISDFETTLRMTREHFKTPEITALQGVYIEGKSIVICHTGTGPNAGTTAGILAGLWNAVHDMTAPASHDGAKQEIDPLAGTPDGLVG